MELFTLASSTALMSSVGASVQSTSWGMYPLVAAIFGLTLTFWVTTNISRFFHHDKVSHKSKKEEPSISTVEYVEHRMRRADFQL